MNESGTVALKPHVGFQDLNLQAGRAAWYCARTKPKHEHIAAANVRKRLNLEVFLPRLQIERATRRGLVRLIEPLFPCYIFIQCLIEQRLHEIQRTEGISNVVRFGLKIPPVPDRAIKELQKCFQTAAPKAVKDRLSAGDEVVVGDGAFAGMRASVLRVLPASQRVQVLLDILGGLTPVEVDRCSIVPWKNTLADLAPDLAAAAL